MKTHTTLDDIKIECGNREYSDAGHLLYAQLNGVSLEKHVTAHLPELRGTLRIRFSADVDMVTMAQVADRVRRIVDGALTSAGLEGGE